jgi:hypothetical protein
LVECKLVKPLWEAVWRLLKKLKTELPYDPVIPLLGIYLKEYKTRSNRDTAQHVCCSTIHNSQVNGLRKYVIYICIYIDIYISICIYIYISISVYIYAVEYYSAIRNEIMTFGGKWMELEINILSEVIRSRKTIIICFLSYVEARPKR